jgi:O-antigen ligase
MQDRHSAAVYLLAGIFVLVPALGVHHDMLLQDTLKSMVLAAGTWALTWLLVWQGRAWRWHGLVALPLVLAAYAAGSMVWGHTYLAAVEAVRWLMLALLLWGVCTAVQWHHVPRVLGGVYLGASLASVWAALQFWWAWEFFPQAAVPASSFINRNFFAEYAVLAVPYSVGWLAGRPASRWLPILALPLALNLTAIAMTGTRAALVALATLLPALLWVLWRFRAQWAWAAWPRRLQGAVLGVVGLALVVLVNLPTHNEAVLREGAGSTPWQRSTVRAASIVGELQSAQGTFSVRTGLWMASARMLAAQPLAGVGAGAWEVEIPLYQRVGNTLETDYYAHNEFLQILCEYGALVGGLVLAFLLAHLLLAGYRLWHTSAPQARAGPVRGLALCSLSGLLVVSLAGFPWHLAGTGALMVLGLGLLAGADWQTQADTPANTPTALAFTPPPGLRSVLLAVLALAGVVMVYVSAQAAIAERHIVQAARAADHATRAFNRGEASTPAQRAAMLEHVRQGIAINPHYRRLTALVAEPLVATGDCANAVWILQSVVQSRPHVAALWMALARCESQLQQHDRAHGALLQVQRLQPNAAATGTLAVRLAANQGHVEAARQLADRLLTQGGCDEELTDWAYALGYKTADWSLVIRALELRIQHWPARAPDAYMRLGKVYADALHDKPRAEAAFRAGLALVPAAQQADFKAQMPAAFQVIQP